MSRHYQHLNATERAMIRLLDDKGRSVREIARRIGRSPATVSRERQRGQDEEQRYCPTVAARVYQQRRRRSRRRNKLVAGSALQPLGGRHPGRTKDPLRRPLPHERL